MGLIHDVFCKDTRTIILLARSMADEPPSSEVLMRDLVFDVSDAEVALPLLRTALDIGANNTNLPVTWAQRLFDEVLYFPGIEASRSLTLTVSEAWGLLIAAIETAVTMRKFYSRPDALALVLPKVRGRPLASTCDPAVELCMLADAIADTLVSSGVSLMTAQLDWLRDQ